MNVVMAAAGTAGHVYPALAVAEELVSRGLDRSQIVFFGGDRIERQAVPSAGFPFVEFRLAKLRRSASLSNLAIPAVVSAGARRMRRELERRSAHVLLGMGGYATVPAAIAAKRARVPMLVHEQNAVPGLASRFAARRASRVLLGLPGPAQRLATARLVGNPLRREFLAFERAVLRPEARERYQVAPGTLVLGVLGGSLGARVLNDAIPGLAAHWDGPPVTIVHLTGPGGGEAAEAAAQAALPWRCRTYEDRMDLFYAAADLVVCRAGAMTVAELAATATPAVLVPLERVGQGGNAAALAAVGGGEVLAESELARLGAVTAALFADTTARQAMGRAAASLARPDAAQRIADAVCEVAR
jgi:UDP-N-acetylglucosamine--N-acetylmuramyl-(pentapeptide) pyrophosphoryl-undecaprenol N-acetylglucosamine transferase